MTNESPTDAQTIVDSIQARLIALVEGRAFRFMNTRRDDAQAYLARLTTFEGLSESSIAQRERVLGGALPQVYRQYLATMGRVCGDLFRGSDVDAEGWEERRVTAQEIAGDAFTMRADREVFRVHQGYAFSFVLAEGGHDGPVMAMVEGDSEPRQEAKTFAELLDREVALMETNLRASTETGGYFVQVYGSGGVGQLYPALSSGTRPIDMGDQYRD